MAEDYEPYHVPQQSRRDKLRVVALAQSHPGSSSSSACIEDFQAPTSGLVMSLYDPSLLSSDLLTCANLQLHHTLGVVDGLDPKSSSSNNQACYDVKEESANMIGYVGGRASCSSSSTSQQPHQLFLDPQSSLNSNPSPIQDANSNNQFFFAAASHNPRLLDHHQPFSCGEVVVYKPEPLSIAGHHQLNNATVQGLSLSLSSQHTHKTNLPLELNLQNYESSAMFHDKIAGGCVAPGIGGGASMTNDLPRSSVPLGPFTGYASILKGSRFLKPAQQLLEELCDVGSGIYAERVAAAPDSALMDPPLECLSASGVVDESTSSGEGGERQRKKSRLISMLEEVYRRYKHYYQQMQAVVASFECVAGLSNAAPFANLALKAMSKHFRCLKNAITDQLQFATKSHGHISYGKDDTPRSGNPDTGLHSHRAIHSSGFIEHQPVWRPQRGLPERAVTVLRAWLFEHFLHPYPTDTDKLMLAKQTGLSRNQVSNWFINARVRLWKPMVEEIHMLETRQAQRASQKEEKNVSRQNDDMPAANSLASKNQSNSPQGIHALFTKCTRNDFPNIPMGSDEPINLSYNNLLRHATSGGVGVSTAGASGGVSLTLGLHQNNGIGLSEPFSIPMNAARRFGLDTNSEGYVIGGFGTETRQFGRSVVGSQLLHDFVG